MSSEKVEVEDESEILKPSDYCDPKLINKISIFLVENKDPLLLNATEKKVYSSIKNACFINDINPTGNTNFLTELVQANKIRDTFDHIHHIATIIELYLYRLQISGIIHDANNLLTSANITLEMALAEVKSSDSLEQVKSHLAIGSSVSDKMIKASALLHAYRSSTETKVLKKTCLLKDILRELLHGFQYQYGNRIQLSMNIAEDFEISISAESMIRVISNLITNSIEAIGEQKGEITITANKLATPHLQENQYLQISIRDNGVGIDPKAMEQIFDVGVTTKDSNNEEGRGLGLYLVKTIVDSAGGSVRAHSVEGEFTEFYINVPLAKEYKIP